MNGASLLGKLLYIRDLVRGAADPKEIDGELNNLINPIRREKLLSYGVPEDRISEAMENLFPYREEAEGTG